MFKCLFGHQWVGGSWRWTNWRQCQKCKKVQTLWSEGWSDPTYEEELELGLMDPEPNIQSKPIR